jgi:hypothetical protein
MSKQGRLSLERAEKRREREAIRQAREQEIEALARRRRRQLVTMVISLLAIATFVIAAMFILTHSWRQRERVTGRLAGVRELSFTPAVQENGGVSPVCGCFKPHFNAWRGITFATREVLLSRRGPSPFTEWTISGAEAKEGIEPAPAAQRMAVEVVQMEPIGRFDPAWMVHDELDQHGRILSHSTFNAFLMSFTTSRDLHVGLLGDVPLGAWIPLPRSEVELTAAPSPFPGSPTVPRITEKHPPGRGMDEVRFDHGRVRGQGYPIGDFLGPNLVLWSDSPFVEVSGWPLEKGQAGGRRITAVRLKRSTFSTRISAVPLSKGEFFEHLPYMLAAPHRGHEYVYSGRPDGGEVVVRVTKPLGRRAYARLRRRVLAHPVIHMRPVNFLRIVFPNGHAEPGRAIFEPPRIDLRPGDQGNSTEKTLTKVMPIPERDRYPPLPRVAGFNIFGPLHAILFRGVHGDLLIADQAKSLSGSADLRLTDVSGLRNEAGEELVPAPLSTSAGSATLQFHAVSEARINGVPQTVTTFMEEWHAWLAALGFAFATLGAVFGVRAFLRQVSGAGESAS